MPKVLSDCVRDISSIPAEAGIQVFIPTHTGISAFCDSRSHGKILNFPRTRE